MVMFSSSKKIISKYCIIWLSRKNSYKKICYPCDSIFKKEFWRKKFSLFLLVKYYYTGIFL